MQGIDGSARKPALVQDINYMFDKTFHMALFLDHFEVNLLPFEILFLIVLMNYIPLLTREYCNIAKINIAWA